MTCSSCGTQNPPGRKFCRECGAALAMPCPACGAPNVPGDKFCGECGASLGPDATGAAAAPARAREGAAAERRLVSVLFADLVGFTTLSESRDAEEVRELLSRYFDTCRRIIERYGGAVEKFIGDAVMAVWGTPVAKEDDAERAVRAALDLTDAVSALGQEVGAPDLRARAAVLTGDAAVTIGAEGQGMVAGDLVNTASRIQSAAQPGQVYVGEVTRRATEAAIVYEDAGAHALKGKAEPVPLWRALRVVAAVGGGQKSAGLEAPFVGRDREIRLLKDLFHETADGSKAHLVSAMGVAGVGKSRLAWEFFKYIDGLADTVRWHRGRCLSYGDGVAYWALAEMVRTRAGIVEGEETQSALAKLRAVVEHDVPDPEERRFVEPRLAHLLGIEERVGFDREDLFAAWRRFYELLADEMPTIMVFEDCQWADQGLLDFVEYLLEWSRDHRLFVVTLARPEFAERRPNWGTGRSSTSVYLEPLPAPAMQELLSGLVPGLPEELRDRILARAAGIALYAVETVRMLLDRGKLVQEGSSYRPSGPIDSLDVPETLHALIAARLDGLAPEERRILQDAAVLGKTFTREALAAVSGLAVAELEPLLTSMVRKEVLSVQADPRSPERGQYGFLQDLVKQVAYETLSKRERKAKHLVVAAYLESAWGSEEEEIVEVVASHYLDAYHAAPEAPDADEIKGKARDMTARAGERAASLAATAEAERYFERAAELAPDPVSRAELSERAGDMALRAARLGDAERLYEAAVELFNEAGEARKAARASGKVAAQVWPAQGRHDESIPRLEQVLVELEGGAGEDVAEIASRLARLQVLVDRLPEAREHNETALDVAEALRLPEVLARGLETKGLIALVNGHFEEAIALLGHAFRVAGDADITGVAERVELNLAEALGQHDRYQEAMGHYVHAVEVARRKGDRLEEWGGMVEMVWLMTMSGQWDEALALAAQIPATPDEDVPAVTFTICTALPQILVARGDLDAAGDVIERFQSFEHSPDIQERSTLLAGRAPILRARGDARAALGAARECLVVSETFGPNPQPVKLAAVEGAEAALELGERAAAEEIVGRFEAMPPGHLSPYLRAQACRLRARLRMIDSDVNGLPESESKAAAGMFRELGVPFWLAVTQLEHSEWLVSQGRAEETGPLVDEARETFERLRARPWVERLERVRAGAEVSA